MLEPTADDEAFYVLDRRSYIPTILTQGPWDPGAQHGGPVAGLLASIVDSTPSLVPMRVVRLTVDLLRPVPLERLDVERRVVREGKRIQAVEVLLLCGTLLVARCSALRIRVGADTTEGAPPGAVDTMLGIADVPGPQEATPLEFSNAYVPGIHRGVDICLGPNSDDLPPVMWLRVHAPIVAGHGPNPLAALAVASDFTSLSGSPASIYNYFAVNADINLHIFRLPEGEWIGVRGTTAFSSTGVGQSASSLLDPSGRLATASCAQVVQLR